MKTCCIIGHRNFKINKELEFKSKNIIINLIAKVLFLLNLPLSLCLGLLRQ